MSWNLSCNSRIIGGSSLFLPSTPRPSIQGTLAVGLITVLAMANACSSVPYTPPVSYSEINRVRQEFLGGLTVGLSYYPSSWDGMIEGKGATGRRVFGQNSLTGKYEMAFYMRLKNLSNAPLRVASSYFSMSTVKGQKYSPGQATDSTSRPFPTTELQPQALAEGYIVFELPLDVLASDQVSLLEYDDGLGNRAVRYLSIPDMVQYEWLVSGKSEVPPPQGKMGQEQRWIPSHWENEWIPGRWYRGVWYPGRYETFWIEGRWE